MSSVFFSHSGADTDAARRLVRRLEAAGFDVWFDKDDLKPGREGWQRRLYDAIRSVDAFVVYVGARGVVNWVQAEVNEAVSRAITRTADDPFVFVPILSRASKGYRSLPGFARQFQSVSDVENDPDQWNRLIHALANGNPPIPEESPFFGLKAVDEARSHLFYGRAKETSEVADRLAERGVVHVTGASGSGKSSLLKAGLVPAWHGNRIGALRGYRPEDRVWHTIITRPGKAPFSELYGSVTEAARSMDLSPADVEELGKLARDGDLDARKRALRCGLDRTSTSVLLVVDQFEELWDPAVSETDREGFLNLLTDLIDPDDLSFAVALSMRDDYTARLTLPEAASLAALLDAQDRRARFPLRAIGFLDRDDAGTGDDTAPRNSLSDIVTKPLSLARWKADDQKLQERAEAEALARMVIADATDRPGDLALVQFALTRAWDTRAEHDNNLQTAYVASGRFEGALAQSAEQAFGALKRTGIADDQIEAAMVRLGSLAGAGPLRRVAPRFEFSDAGWNALQFLASPAGFRLVLIEGEGKDTRVEIAHEALLTQWARLNNWLARHAEDVRLLHGLAGRVQEMRGELTPATVAATRPGLMQRLGLRPPDPRGPVLSGLDLKRFEPLQRRHPMWLAVAETDLLQCSEADVAALQKSETRVKQYMGGLLVTLTIAVVGAVLATLSSQTAERRAAANAAAAMAGLAEVMIERKQGVRAGILALAALERQGNSSAPSRILSILDASIAASIGIEFRTLFPEATVFAFSPDGQYLITGDFDGRLRLWNNHDFSFVRETVEIVWDAPTSLMVAPDSNFLAAGYEDGTLRLWNIPDLTFRDEVFSLHEGTILSVAISANGQRVATGGNDGRIRQWNSTNFDRLAEGPGDARVRARALNFSDDDRFIVFESDNALSGLMNVVSGALVEIDGAIVADQILVSKTGMIIRLGPGTSTNGSVGNLDLRTSDDFRLVEELPSGSWGTTRAIAVSTNGEHIARGDHEGAIRLLSGTDLRSLNIEGLPPFTPSDKMQSGVNAIAFSPDGQRVASSRGDGTIWIWNTDGLSLLGPPLRGFDGIAFGVIFSPEGRFILSDLSFSTNGPIIWDLSRGGADRIALLCHRIDSIASAEIAALEAEYGLTLPSICTPEQRALQLPAIWVPSLPITIPAIEGTTP